MGVAPWRHVDLEGFLTGRGFRLVTALSAHATVVAGAHDWLAADIDMLVDFELDQQIQIIPQELFVLGLIRCCDPCDLVGEEQLAEIARSHPLIRTLVERGVTWPVRLSRDPDDESHVSVSEFEVEPVALQEDVDRGGEGGSISTSGWSDGSVVSRIGYTVKEGALSVRRRRRYLEIALTHDLSEVASPHELGRWGRPATTRRLQAIVNFMLWLNRLQSADKPAARQRRLDDLAWLRDRYDLSQTRIEWPSLVDWQ